jgi:hypothetical protein
MLFAELTEQQQALATQLDTELVRPALLTSRTSITLMRHVVLQYDAVTKAILDELADDVIVEYTGSLAGAVPVTAGAIRAMVAAFRTLLSLWDTEEVRLLHTAFVGGINIEGRV